MKLMDRVEPLAQAASDLCVVFKVSLQAVGHEHSLFADLDDDEVPVIPSVVRRSVVLVDGYKHIGLSGTEVLPTVP